MRISRRTLLILAETTGDILALSLAEDLRTHPGEYQVWYSRQWGARNGTLYAQDHGR